MTTATLTANYLLLSKVCEFWFMADNAAVPFVKCNSGELAETLNAIGGDRVVVEFRTTSDPKEVAADIRKFSKRLAAVSANWVVGEWQIEVINGYPQTAQRMCILTRKPIL